MRIILTAFSLSHTAFLSSKFGLRETDSSGLKAALGRYRFDVYKSSSSRRRCGGRRGGGKGSGKWS